MGDTTGIGWCDATVNFWIGCTMVGPGCGEVMPDGRQIGCYAAEFAKRKFNITFGPGERRHRTQAGYENPRRWQRMHDRGQTTMRQNHADVPVPRWVFCNSLADMFDNEIPAEWRADAWKVIRECPALRWQIVTKRVGNVAKMLPADWDGGRNYPHVGIIATMVNQEEVDRDGPKLMRLKPEFGVRWIGVSMEPQLEEIDPTGLGGTMTVRLPVNPVPPTQPLTEDDTIGHSVAALGGSFIPNNDGVDWIITGGESNQGDHKARPYDLDWAQNLILFGRAANIPIFVKQMGDNPKFRREPFRKMRDSGSRPEDWPRDFRVQEMPRVFDGDPAYVPQNLPKQADMPLPSAPSDPTLF